MTDGKSKYAIKKMPGGWVVVMAANGHIMTETFGIEEEAAAACDQFKNGKRTVGQKADVWVIDKTFVCEAGLGGMQYGMINDLDMNQFNITSQFSQREIDEMVKNFSDEEGHYPDT